MQMSLGFLFLCQLMLMASMAYGSSLKGEEQLEALLDTETQLIDELRDYIERLELQLEEIRRETEAIAEVHRQVDPDGVEEYMGNPLNVLTILKRFDSVWPRLEQMANATDQLGVNEEFTKRNLALPTDEEYEESLSRLLHLQSVYDLEPSSLSLGLVNGIKMGSAMTWGDCLEVARNSESSVARFWLETAMNKLPSPTENSTDYTKERENGRVQILEEQLNMEYKAGELTRALTAAEELLLLFPTNQNVLKAKVKIEKRLAKKDLPAGKTQKSKEKTQKTKSAEQLLVGELCRGATQAPTIGSRFSQCHFEGRTPWTLLQPARLEPLSLDPHVVLYHNVMTLKQTDQLLELTDEQKDSRPGYQPLEFSKLAQKKLKSILHHLDDKKGVQKPAWEARRHSHEHTTSRLEDNPGHVARGMLKLQEAGMGGALVFPQLELAVNIPRGSVLYWRTRTSDVSSPEWDYRSQHAVCPVLLGFQV
ncbi:hypothetical protein KR067_006920, partial [Drosophila pandora]